MFKSLFGRRTTTKSDVVFGIAGAIIGIWKCLDTIKEYKADHESENQEIAP